MFKILLYTIIILIGYRNNQCFINYMPTETNTLVETNTYFD